MRDDNLIHLDEAEMRQKINMETAQIGWSELQREFARGVLVVVGPGLDLVDVALVLNRDDAAQFQAWAEAGQVRRALDEDAMAWNESQPEFWSVVVAPWVLVQVVAAH